MSVDPKKICILLTATVDPKGVPFMNRGDPKIREADYIKALKRWAETDYSLVFCENSDWDLGAIRRTVGQGAEVLQFYGQGFSRHLGKGYGEMQTIKYAIEHSALVRDCEYVIKVNGRYFISNISKITSIFSPENNVYLTTDFKRNLTWADSRVFAFEKSFVPKYLCKYAEMIDDSNGFYLEHALARAGLLAISEGRKWLPFPSRPRIVGFSGTFGKCYDSSLFYSIAARVKHRLKNYLNKRF